MTRFYDPVPGQKKILPKIGVTLINNDTQIDQYPYAQKTNYQSDEDMLNANADETTFGER